jgi:transcriptional regulator with XRE-family HTH domain
MESTDIGKKIRELREAKNLKMKDLSAMVECTPSLISQLERGKTDPSISMLKKIARALNVNIVDFFMNSTHDEDVVTRTSDRIDIQLKKWDARIQSLVKKTTNKKMQPFFTVVKSGGGSHGIYSHDGEEFGFVLKGELELMVNDKIHTVRENESFYFSSTIPHNWGNRGKEDAVVIWVITPPTF